MKDRQNQHIIDILFVLALFALFVLSAIFLISIGANIYTKTMSNMDKNFNSRTAVAYINEKLRQSDAEHSIETGYFGDCPSIIIKENINNKEYNTYIYSYNNKLMELTVRSDISLSPEAGQPIIDIYDFKIDKTSDSLIHLSFVLDDDKYEFYSSIKSGGKPDEQ